MDSNGTHTRAPWTVTERAVENAGPIAYIHGDTGHEEVAVLYADKHQAENARLIAAAPDLLDALRAFCGDHEATGFECAGLNAAYQHALSVIAKAEGRS